MRRPTPPTTWLSLIPPSPKNRQFSSFRLSGFHLPCILSACRPLSFRPYYIFHFFTFPKILESACTMALPHLTLRKLHEISISRNYFRLVACNAVVSRLCGLSSITWKCASIALIACGLSGGGSTMMVIGCGNLACSGASAGVSRYPSADLA